MTKFDSTAVEVFPASGRTYVDKNSKLMSEQNIVSIVNRLTGKPSFIISGILMSSEANIVSLYKGEVNIGGYYFKFINDNPISLGTSNNTYCILKINLVESQVTTTVGTDTYSSTFTQLNNVDTNEYSLAGDVSDKFTGISYEFVNSLPEDKNTFVVIAEKISNKWHPFTYSKLIFDSNEINIVSNKALNNTTFDGSLSSFLDDYYVIDDGDLG